MNSSPSDQHKDLRPESVRLSQKHIKLFTDFFAAHPPFPSHHNTLIDISTGFVAAPNVNCDDTFEVPSQTPALFQHGLLRKNNKSDLSIALKEYVEERSLTTSDNITVVIDGGHLLNTVQGPTDATYHEIAANYVKHVCIQLTYMPVIVVFDGYGSAATSTKNTEHQRRDILFDTSMKPFVAQHSFLGNPTNKTRLSIITQCFVNDCVHCKQAEGGADRLIVSTALEVSNPVLVVATDTDILVMLVNQASGIRGGVNMGRGLTSCVNVLDIQEQIGTVKTHLLVVRVA